MDLHGLAAILRSMQVTASELDFTNGTYQARVRITEKAAMEFFDDFKVKDADKIQTILKLALAAIESAVPKNENSRHFKWSTQTDGPASEQQSRANTKTYSSYDEYFKERADERERKFSREFDEAKEALRAKMEAELRNSALYGFSAGKGSIHGADIEDLIRGYSSRTNSRPTNGEQTNNKPWRTGARWFEILGVSISASRTEIKLAYRKAASKYHPDKNGGDTKLMQAINKARDEGLAGASR